MASDMAKGTNVAGKVGPGMAVGDTSLSGAVATLHEQHPQKWSDRGPHHEQVGKISRGGKLHQSGG
jgi:hypothetical protein